MIDDQTLPPEAEPDSVINEPQSSFAVRPTSVTMLALGVVIIGALNLARFGLALHYWDFLAGLTNVSPLYLALSGLVWGLAGGLQVWGLLQGKTWAPRFMRAIALTYVLYFWLDQVFLQDHPMVDAEGSIRLLLPGNWSFTAGLTIILLVFILWTLQRRAAKAYFGETNEHRSEN
jgi:hypothetical protein